MGITNFNQSKRSNSFFPISIQKPVPFYATKTTCCFAFFAAYLTLAPKVKKRVVIMKLSDVKKLHQKKYRNQFGFYLVVSCRVLDSMHKIESKCCNEKVC